MLLSLVIVLGAVLGLALQFLPNLSKHSAPSLQFLNLSTSRFTAGLWSEVSMTMGKKSARCVRTALAILVAVISLSLTQAGVHESQAQPAGPSGGLTAAPAAPTNPPAAVPDESRTGVNPPPRDGSSGPIGIQRILTRLEFWLSLIVLLFGFVVVFVEYRLLRLRSFTSEEILRVFTVTLIIVGTLFALTAGFDSQQIAPAMGLFGTIAGYLLGRRYPASPPPVEASGKGAGS